jgi:hypothetical protein
MTVRSSNKALGAALGGPATAGSSVRLGGSDVAIASNGSLRSSAASTSTKCVVIHLVGVVMVISGARPIGSILAVTTVPISATALMGELRARVTRIMKIGIARSEVFNGHVFFFRFESELRC